MELDGTVPEHVLEQFGAVGAEVDLLAGGRTNRTMHVRAGHELVLQHLVATPGTDLIAVMENLVRVTSHLDWVHSMGLANLTSANLTSADQASSGHGFAGEHPTEAGETWWPQLVPTASRKPYIMTESGDVWRAYAYRPGRIARDVVASEAIESAACLFGKFSRLTLDLGGPDLVVSTHGFHDLENVWAQFEHACDDPRSIAAAGQVTPHIDEIEALRSRLTSRCAVDGLDRCRDRVVHNDTKLSNALLHATDDAAVAVLDLDLVMMGPIWHDIGDLVRSSCWHRQPAGAHFDVDAVVDVMRSFVVGLGDAVEPDELATFAVAGPRLAFELGVRYLTDHLRSEPALRVAGIDGHLHRGLANLKLATEMLKAYDALRSEVDELSPHTESPRR